MTSICSCQYLSIGDCATAAHLHGAVVDFDTVELGCSLCSTARIAEEDGSNTTALAVGSISEQNSLDRPDSIDEVVLDEGVHD
jgi:hypothetical protein